MTTGRINQVTTRSSSTDDVARRLSRGRRRRRFVNRLRPAEIRFGSPAVVLLGRRRSATDTSYAVRTVTDRAARRLPSQKTEQLRLTAVSFRSPSGNPLRDRNTQDRRDLKTIHLDACDAFVPGRLRFPVVREPTSTFHVRNARGDIRSLGRL